MADGFEKAVGHIVHVGAREFSVLGMIEDAVKPFLPAGADERLRAAVEADAREAFVRLQSRVAAVEAQLQEHGRQLDDLGWKRTTAVAQEVAQGLAGAYGEPKIEAVLNAGARQFDPRMGPQETRKHWLDRAMQLSDLEVRALLLLKNRQPVFYFERADQMFWGDKGHQQGDLPDEDRVALGTVLRELAVKGELVIGTTATATIDVETAAGVVLSPQGSVLVRFIEPISET